MGLGIETEEELGGFDGTRRLGRNLTAHLTLAPRAHAMRVNGQELAAKVIARATDFSQGDLKILGLSDGESFEHLMDGLIRGNERQAIGQLETLLTERTIPSDAGGAQGGFVDQLKRQAWVQVRGGPTRPGAKQVPCTQPHVFGRQKPETDLRARNLIGQPLTNAALEASVIARFDAHGAFGAPGLHRGQSWRVEFFFEAPTR